MQTTAAEEIPTAGERARTPVGQIGATIASIPRQTQSSGSHRSRSEGTQMNTVVNDLLEVDGSEIEELLPEEPIEHN